MFRTVPILLFLLTFWPALSMAQGNPAYTVHDVKVDIVAESAVKARDQAFLAAQTQAFKMLSERFLSPEQLSGFVPPDAASIAGMVADFEITSEQQSKKRYLGNYIFRFKPASVNRYFGHGPLESFSATADSGSKLLVLPVFIQNGQPALWDLKKNPWLEAWQKQNTDKASSLIIPKADVSDTMDIREFTAEKIPQSGLKRIRSRYGAEEIVILSAVFDQAAKDMLKVSIYRTDRGKVELVQVVPFQQGKATRLGELLGNIVPQVKTMLSGNWKGEVNYDPYATSMTTGMPVTAQSEMAPTTTAPAPYAPQSGQVWVTSSFTNMADWLAIRRSLNGIPPLKSLRIVSLTTNQARMEFIYSDWMALTSALSARGLSLQSTGPGGYNLIKISNRTGYR